MTFFADLSRCTYHPVFVEAELYAVGWLSDHVPTRGRVPHAVVERLVQRTRQAFDPLQFRGYHECEMCPDPVYEMQDSAGRVLKVGQTNLLIPRLEPTGLFVVPSLILHYIVDHEYAPPVSFQEAVMWCPADDVDYLRAIDLRLPRPKGRPDPWRDRMCGLRSALGQALSAREGLMDFTAWDDFHERHGLPMSGARDPDPTPPSWFVDEHIAPILGLAERLESSGDISDAEAVRTWLSSLEFFARWAPPQRP